jgi:hypothetical protein
MAAVLVCVVGPVQVLEDVNGFYLQRCSACGEERWWERLDGPGSARSAALGHANVHGLRRRARRW